MYVIVYRTKETLVKFAKTLVITFITEALIASIIAIARIPLSQSIITIMLFVAIIEIMFIMNKKEKVEKEAEVIKNA